MQGGGPIRPTYLLWQGNLDADDHDQSAGLSKGVNKKGRNMRNPALVFNNLRLDLLSESFHFNLNEIDIVDT